MCLLFRLADEAAKCMASAVNTRVSDLRNLNLVSGKIA